MYLMHLPAPGRWASQVHRTGTVSGVPCVSYGELWNLRGQHKRETILKKPYHVPNYNCQQRSGLDASRPLAGSRGWTGSQGLHRQIVGP